MEPNFVRTVTSPKPRSASPLPEINVLWLTAGLSCDGDTVAITAAASQPRLEKLVLGAIPGVPRVRLHHPVLSDENGDDEQADFADTYGTPQCIVKLGCRGPVVLCHVGKRGRRFRALRRVPRESMSHEPPWRGANRRRTGEPSSPPLKY